MARVLVVDDEPSIRETLAEFLTGEGHAVMTAESVAEATQRLMQAELDVVVTDIILPQASGLDLLRHMQRVAPDVKVILITGEPSYESAALAVRHGACDYLPKPVTQEAIVRVVAAAARLKTAEDENRRYRERLEHLVEERTRQIAQYTERLRRVAEQTRSFARCGEVPDLAPCILTVLARDMAADGGSFFLLQADALELVAVIEETHQPRRIVLPLPEGSILDRALRLKEGVLIRDLAQHAELQPSGWGGYRDGSLLAVPCVDGNGDVLGIVTLHNKQAPPFTEEDLEIGRIIAAHAVEAIRAIELNRKLRVSEREFRDLSEHSLTGIVVIEDGRIAYANPRVVENLGFARAKDLLGRDVISIVHEQDRARAGAHLARIVGGSQERGHEELRVVRVDGSIVWIEALGIRVEREGRAALLVNTVDVTARKRAEQERRQLEARLLQSQKMEAVGRLAGGVAHDFNNVLTAIIGYADFLQSELGRGHPNWADAMEIRQAADRATALTRQLLAFSRREIRQPRVLRLNEVVSQARKLIGRLIGEDVSLRFSAGPDLWPVRADPRQIEQILLNLATNARDAMPQGGTVTITSANVQLEGGAGDRRGVELRVEDTGCGMDAETSRRAFEPFFTTKERGTGLGLATVREIVEADGGRVLMESAPGGGTRVVIRLPAAVPEDGPAWEASEAASGEGPRGSETILLVEDDAAVRQVTRAMLVGSGYQVLEARDASEGLGLAREQAGRIDLLLSDVVLPGKNGPALLEDLRRLRPDVKHLFMSGYAEDAVAQRGVVQPGVRLLQKPFAPGQLTRAVRAALDETPTL